MHAAAVPFGCGTAFNLTDAGVKQELLRDLSDRLRVRDGRDSRAWNPDTGVSAAGSYVLHLQSRGSPYVLMLTRVGFTELCAYVDLRVRPGHHLPRVVSDHQMFSPELFDGTAICGEMVRSRDGEWRFLAHDVLAISGRPLFRVPFRERYAALLKLLETAYRPDHWATHTVHAQQMFPADEDGMSRLTAHAHAAPYEVAGYVMRSLLPSRTNWFVRVYPGEAARETSRDAPKAAADSKGGPEIRLLRLRSTVAPDVYENDEGLGVGVPGIDISKELQLAFVDAGGGAIIPWRCAWNPAFKKWVPLEGGRS